MNNFLTRFKDPLAWAYGLISGILMGGASAGLTYLTIGGNTTDIEWRKLGTIFAVNAILSALLYLKQSPLPALEDSNAK